MGIVRKTHSLNLLLGEFHKSSSAISTVQLVKKFKSKINKSTIYRILDKLEDDGVLHTILGKDGVKQYAKCTSCSKSIHTDNHPHLQCTICNKIYCLDVAISIPEIPKYKVNNIRVFLEGECNFCKLKN
ncbi:Fur family transcriptional regulator [Polaribacter cellanae]|uniref:Transcriptional repressor n=1 Tax=Polaribacter cellanae TaxID=2818493 RepID=A0A975CQN6_9FLAO|nr:transcriptional repressor [Polaribacter cellanae]QTE23079.1 transcriptional repressor [Polaribacter cellanae]